jgi:hypothetical protein
MARQLLIYENAVPVSAERHRELWVKGGTSFGFARDLNSVPLTLAEIPPAGAEYPVVFVGENPMPVMLSGAREAENLYVDDAGSWTGRYVPAFLRRYPFVFATPTDGKTYTLCIDESFGGCNREGRGEPLFDAEGRRTQFLENALEFTRLYQAQHELTLAFGRRLKVLELLEPMQAEFKLKNGRQMRLTGFDVVSRQKLKALPGDTLAELVESDGLELIYLHLGSLRHLDELMDRVSQRVVARTDG